MNTALKNELINKYRESIATRYNYDLIKSDPHMPKAFKRKDVDELRAFFLDNLYAAPKQRERLDAAFKQLETYVAHPAKVWGLLGNLASAIFQFGLQFPAALRVGVISLKTHTSARHFEDMLLQKATEKGFTASLTEEQFNECLAALPPEQLEDFIKELTELFHAICNTDLLQKTVHILNDVLERMKKKKDLYGPEDTDAIQLGIDILNDGHALLSKYDAETRNSIVEFVTYSEMKFLQGLQGKPKKGKKSKEEA